MQIIKLDSHLDIPFVHLQQLYEFELVPFTGYKINEHGLYDQEFLRSTWSQKGVDIYVLYIDDLPAGFAVVNLSSMLGHLDTRDIAEFFVMPEFRRRDIGKRFAQSIFAKYPGRWEVRQIAALVQAREFWLKTILNIGDISDFREDVNPPGWEGWVQSFVKLKTKN